MAISNAKDAVDAIRRWCDEQQYENDLITVGQLREFLPENRDDTHSASDDNGWQPIETAPKNETEILLYGDVIRPSIDAGKKAVTIGYWTGFNHGGWVWYGAAMNFTHWQPLPAPPVEGA